ncbi:unnamed protein product [Adineta steineri]|uniref:PAS domain-containing protein n=1 Tax=Adineta steineri TaxID=433720 RepID=A0A813YD56_9BILA|nr:unnamed protein product [Adineta steineri]
MSQQNIQQQGFSFTTSAGSMNDFNNFNLNFDFNIHQAPLEVSELPKGRRDVTNDQIVRLYKATLIKRPGERVEVRTSGRKNKNEILGLTLTRLIKDKHLKGNKYSYDMELLRGIPLNMNNSEFVLVLRTDGRIVAMSDEVEQHLGKSMRSLYTQCRNLFECLDNTDCSKLRSILSSSVTSTGQEHRLVCTLRLPKGKRPSRASEDIKTITMAGHFYSCHETTSTSHERLFIARCEALISTTTNKPSSSQTNMMIDNKNNINGGSTLRMTLNEDMSINTVTSNVKDILGYSRTEIIGNWVGRYLATDDLEKCEIIRQKYVQRDQQRQQLPSSTCDIFDMYATNGQGRLTFFCQIRPIRERRSKSIKFSFVAQLIDPSLRSEYVKYIQTESITDSDSIKAEQVNPGAQLPASISKTSEDAIMANSPSVTDMGFLIFDNFLDSDFTHQQQCSPINRTLSNDVAPVSILDESWQQLFGIDYNQHTSSSLSATADFQCWPTKSCDEIFNSDQIDVELNDIFNDYLYGY